MMIKGDLKSYINYYQTWAEAHEEVKFFCFGSVEKGIEFARSLPEFDYPFAWLEQPVIGGTNNGAAHLNHGFQTGISVLIKAPLDDNDAQIDAYAQALAILQNLLKKLVKDNKKALIHFDLETTKIEAVNQLWIDGHYGFRMELVMDLNINQTIYP